MGKVEVRVSDGQKAEWQAVALERGVSVSEFVRAAVERELGKGVSVAAVPPVVEAEREKIPWPVTDHAKVAAVNGLRDLPGVTTAADLAFAPVAPAEPSVQARVVPWKREVRPDPKSK